MLLTETKCVQETLVGTKIDDLTSGFENIQYVFMTYIRNISSLI